MSDKVIRFGDPYPTPEEVAETMKKPGAGIIGLCRTVVIDSEVGCTSTGTLEPYSGDAGDETA